MAQPSRQKRGLPKDITQRSDRELMEKVSGKRVMRAVDEWSPSGRKTLMRKGKAHP